MKLIVGLGNPGRKYQGTRHNIGFEVAGELARRHGRAKPKAAFQGEVVEAEMSGERVLLLTPHTFMNLSGSSVLEARDFYKIGEGDLLVVCDEFQLPLGAVRMRATGSSGGQKGLSNVIQRLGTDQVPRLRIGIGPVPDGWDPAAFVLGKFNKDEQTEAEIAVQHAADAAAVWIVDGIAEAMNRYN